MEGCENTLLEIYDQMGMRIFPPIRSSVFPVSLDLNGDDHIDLRPLDASTVSSGIPPAFDWSGDNKRDLTAWVGPDDGFLAIDLGADGEFGPDGLIDHARELAFTDWVTPEQVAANGGPVSDLDGLRLVFDSNHDNVLDANDDRWSEFRVWRDANQNGISDAGELQTMSEAGIKLVNLIPNPAGSQAFDDGSAITGTSSYETTNGQTQALPGRRTPAVSLREPCNDRSHHGGAHPSEVRRLA